jgi:hypothetical protein
LNWEGSRFDRLGKSLPGAYRLMGDKVFASIGGWKGVCVHPDYGALYGQCQQKTSLDAPDGTRFTGKRSNQAIHYSAGISFSRKRCIKTVCREQRRRDLRLRQRLEAKPEYFMPMIVRDGEAQHVTCNHITLLIIIRGEKDSIGLTSPSRDLCGDRLSIGADSVMRLAKASIDAKRSQTLRIGTEVSDGS